MAKEVINGRVIYCFVSTCLTADINLTSQGNVMGFKIAAHALKSPEKVMNLLLHIKKGDEVRLVINDGQIVEVSFLGLGKTFSIATYPDLGMSLKESAEQKLTAKFVHGNVHRNGKNIFLQLCVQGAEKSIYCLETDKSQESRVNTFLQKCNRGDILKLSQDPEGKITRVVNSTQAFEFA